MRIKSIIPLVAVLAGACMIVASMVVRANGYGSLAGMSDRWQQVYTEMQSVIAAPSGAESKVKALTAAGWEVDHRRPSGAVIYWSASLDSSRYAFSQSYDIPGEGSLTVHRLSHVKDDLYRDDHLWLAPAVYQISGDTIADLQAGDLSVESYRVVDSARLGYWWQYMGLAGYLLLLAGTLWVLSRKLKARYAVLALSILLCLVVAIPVESIWSDLIMSHGMMEWFGGSLTLTDLVSITAVVVGLALLVSSKSINFQLTQWSGALFGMVSATALVIILRVAQGIVAHPSIQLEVSRIFRFDKYSIVILLCLSVMCVSHLVACVYIWYDGRRVDDDQTSGYLPYVLGGVLTSSLFYFWIGLDIPFVTIYLFMVSYYTMIDLFLDGQRRNVTWLIWWIMILSAFLAVSVFYMSLLKGEQARADFVDDFLIDRFDAQAARLHDQQIQDSGIFDVLADLDSDDIRLDRSDILEYLVRETNTGLEERPQMVEVFADGVTVFGQLGRSRRDLLQQVRRSRVLTAYTSYDYASRTLVSRYEVLVAEDRSIELFVLTPVTSSPVTKAEDSYVLYYGDQPVYQRILSNDLVDYQVLLERSRSEQSLRGYTYTSSQRGDYTVIAFTKLGTLIKPISLFSYLFILMGLIALLITIANSRFRLMRPPVSLKFSSRSTLRSKIQLVVLLMVLFSFVAIGVLTAFYFKNVIASTNSKTINEEVAAVLNQIETYQDQVGQTGQLSTLIANRLDELSFVHEAPMALYDRQGSLIISASMPAVGQRMPYSLFKSPSRTTVAQADELVTYVPLDVQAGKASAYLAVKHPTTIATGRSLIDFLSTIVNVYVFLFLLGGAIAIIIANSITRPLADLGTRLKSIKLGRTNESLEWNSNDEIGALIQDYNNLIVDLERSADIIAMTERDTAWREMAKQVAHEIKNPLTPMKLSIQYLQRAGQSVGENAELIDRVSKTLIEQIDNLTQIANEFSNFAAMPMASNEKLLLNSIVETIHELFRKREDMDIRLVEPITDLWVYADKNHLVRVLNNILKNAIQAIPDDRRGHILISLYQQDANAIVEVKDNGVGIPKDKQNKVFTPNFTTKSSGTGLGLAISVNMMEAFNGRIYFDTVEGQGTSFFVEIPLMRLDQQHDGVRRVFLE